MELGAGRSISTYMVELVAVAVALCPHIPKVFFFLLFLSLAHTYEDNAMEGVVSHCHTIQDQDQDYLRMLSMYMYVGR